MMNANDSLSDKIEIDMNIKKRLENLLKKISNNLKSLYDRRSANYQQKLVIIIQNELINIANILKPLEIFRVEYMEFLKIKTMLSYILENINGIDFDHTKLIFESIYNFNDLIKFKIRLMDDGSLDEYYVELKKFISYLKDLESFFYLDVYEGTGEFDDVIIEMSEVLLDD